MSKNALVLVLSISWFTVSGVLHAADSSQDAMATERSSRYNVVWESPSRDASGVMPIGNGDIAAGVYAIENGDLYLLLAKNDALTYQGDIFKTGRVRIAIDPNPFQSGKPFRQTLDLPSGSIRIQADDVTLRIWADANHPVYHVEIDSPRDVSVAAQPEFWQRLHGCDSNCLRSPGEPTTDSSNTQPTQDVRLEKDGKILWYFGVGDRSVYADDLKYYGVASMAAEFPDPFRFNTFGNLLQCPALTLSDGALRGTGKTFDICIHALTMQSGAGRQVDRGNRATGGTPDRGHARLGRSIAHGGRIFGTGVGLPPRTTRCHLRPANSSPASPQPTVSAKRRTARRWLLRAITFSAT